MWRALKDDLSNLLGPWSPYVSDPEEDEFLMCLPNAEVFADIAHNIYLIEQGLGLDVIWQALQGWF